MSTYYWNSVRDMLNHLHGVGSQMALVLKPLASDLNVEVEKE